MTTCEHVRDQFSAMADGVLEPDELSVCRGHLETCGDCTREWQRFESTLALLHGAEPVRAPAGFVDRVTGAARPAWPRRLARVLFSPLGVKLPIEAAGVALVSVIALILVQRTPEVPPIVPPSSPPVVVQEQRAPAPAAPERTLAKEKPAALPPMEPSPMRQQAPVVADSAAPPPPPTPAVSRSEESAVAPRAAVKSTAQETAGAIARLSAASVSGALVVRDRERAAGALANLVTRVGATEASRNVTGNTLVVEIDLPRGTYATFADGLAGIGAWTPDRAPAEPAAPLRLVLRLTES